MTTIFPLFTSTLIIFLFLFLYPLPFCFSATPEPEVLLLHQLYNTTRGSKWGWHGPIGHWDFTSASPDPCGEGWQGIECSKTTTQCIASFCTVTKITLNRYELTGMLISDWRNFTSLTALDLSGNRLRGPLPIYLPSTLSILRLQVNFFRGIIPQTFNLLKNLIYLDLETNFLTGSLPPSIGEMTSLEILALDRNNFTNTLPTFLGNLQNLRRLDFERNSFLGTIPIEIYSLTKLQVFDLFHNEMTGTLSSLIGNFISLEVLDLGSNLFNGSLPNEIGQLTNLTRFKISRNSFTSSLPSGLWKLSNLTTLEASANHFIGTLPEDLSSLIQLGFLALQDNSLDGTIPSSFGDLINLINLDLTRNQFFGSLPSEFGQLKKLTTIEISENYFTGSIPSTIGGMKFVTWLELQDNLFEGSIPLEIGMMENLRYIIFPNCKLSGPLPCAAFANLTSLAYLDTSLNLLSGSICSEIGHLTSLEIFFSALNQHTGTLPSEMGLLPSLQTVELLYNHLTGTIPTSFGDVTEFLVLSLAYNHLTGSLPSQLGNLLKLEQLYLQKNDFHGKLNPIFWQSHNLNLINLDMSANRFSGNIISELFSLPNLETIAMTSNCFTGTLPTKMCEAKSLSVISLDGLGVGRDCHVQFSTIYPQWRTMWGTIPQCIWSMKNLTVVSLSGNGFGGDISPIPVNTKLINLTLSHNHLTGTIPYSFQTHPFVSLDLSYNKLTGEASNFQLPTNMTFRRVLEVNRLSGGLQSIATKHSPYLNPHTVNFLDGNIFGCDHLPRDDVDYSTYICGSKELDDSFLIFGSLLGFILISLSLVFLMKYLIVRHYEIFQKIPSFVLLLEAIQSLRKYYIYFDSNEHLHEDGFINSMKSKLSQIQSFSYSFRHLKITVILVMVVGFIACLPIYILKGLDSGEYRTHTHLYRWMWTTAFIKGELPAGLLLAAWIISACVLMMMVDIMLSQRTNSQIQPRESSFDDFKTLNSREKYQHIFSVVTMVLINTAIVGVVNGFFVYSTLQELTESSLFWIEISVSIFKITWNSWILPFVTRKYQKRNSPSLLAKLALFNTIFIPCIAATFTSTSCFQGVLVPSREITSTYTYTTCSAFAGFRRIVSGDYVSWCLAYSDIAVDVEPFRPHFYYNNLCGSTILQVYLPVYMYIYAMLLIFPPITVFLLSRYVEYESLPQWFKYFVPAIIWPIASEETIRDSFSSTTSGQGKNLIAISPMLFKRDNIAVSLMLHVALLITFGLCSPILALAIMTVTCLSITQWRILIARFVSLRSQHTKRQSKSSGQLKEDEVLNVLDLVIGDTAACFQSMLWSVLWSSCLFFAFLCWDIASDTVGWIQSCWIPITAFVSLPFIKFCYLVYQKGQSKFNILEFLEWKWMRYGSEMTTTGDPSSSDPPGDILGRASEFGEINPMMPPSPALEMVSTSYSVALPSPNISMTIADLEENQGGRHTI